MSDYLIQHALKNAWCSPRQDLQVIFKPCRISSPHGETKTAPHLWGRLPLPTSQDRYHLYQIGQIHPSLLGLFPQRMVWRNLGQMMELENLIADVYVGNGMQLARFESWVLVSEERNLLLAVKAQPRIADLKTEPVYLRLYSNSFFSSDRADGFAHKIECRGARVVSTEQALLFQRDVQNSQARPGLTNVFVNGKLVDGFLPQNLQVGDIMEYVYDSTVKAVIDFPVRDLQTFDSDLDLKRKYLLHYPGAQVGGESIDYRDDIDVYVLKKQIVGEVTKFEGAYFHKNQNDALRQVTHRDYSVPVPYVAAYQTGRSGWEQIQDLTIRLHIRHSGWHRPLIHEHHRIRELYKLSEQDRVMAMLGIDSNVEVWKAGSLENSFYPKLMDAYSANVNTELVEKAYGYNAIARLLADGPLPVEVVNGRRQVSLSPGLQVNSTMFEYDANGVLLGYQYHASGYEYTPRHAQTTLVEGIVGRGGYKLSTVFNRRSVTLDPYLNYRFYVAPIVNGVADQTKWQDVTYQAGYWMMVGNTATWLVDMDTTAVAIKSDKDFLAYDLTLSPNNGLLRFSIDADALYPSGTAHGVMYIPVGKLELWLNGRALIENLDYFVKWPEVVVVNKDYLVPGNAQKLTVRGTGFCEPTMLREVPEDIGFVEYGLLSRNNRFNIRDDKVMRLVVEGRTFHRSSLIFSENDSGVRMENVRNGAPYVLDDVIVPLRGATPTDTYALRAESVVVDRSIEDYLTMKLPEAVRGEVDLIPERYAIYSPFASTVMYDMINGVLSMEQFKGQYSDRDVRAVLAGYTWLLDYDPTQRALDSNYVVIHPHNLKVETELDIYQYRFLERAIKLFLDGKVDLTRFVRLKPSYI